MIRFISCIVLTAFVFVSCNLVPIIEDLQDVNCSSVTKKIKQLKEEGKLDLFYSSSRALDYTEEEKENVIYFIENTETCLNEIKKTEDGETKLELINAIYEERTVGEVYDLMQEISPEMADEYESLLLDSCSEGLDFKSRSIQSYRNLRLSFDCVENNRTRSNTENSLYNWGTVGGYVSACAVVCVGVVLCRFGVFPWLITAGIVATIAGVATMVTFFVLWQFSDEWKLFQNLVLDLNSSFSETKRNYKDLSLKESQDFFLKTMQKKIRNEMSKGIYSEKISNEVLSKLYEVSLVSNSVQNIIDSMGEYLWWREDFGSKTLTVLAGTGSVALTTTICYFAEIKAIVESIMGLIPSCIKFVSGGISIVLTL